MPQQEELPWHVMNAMWRAREAAFRDGPLEPLRYQPPCPNCGIELEVIVDREATAHAVTVMVGQRVKPDEDPHVLKPEFLSNFNREATASHG
jgi:hypothetical protein